MHKGINTVVDAATLCKRLVNFSAVTPQITFLIRVPLYGYWTKIGLTISIHCAGIFKPI